MPRTRPRRDRLNDHQRRLLRELERIAELSAIDFWRIRERKPAFRTAILRLMRDQLVRGFVIIRYALIDELLGSEICRYFFGQRDFIPLWRTRRFRRFNYYALEILTLLEKLRLVRDIRELPGQVRNDIEAVNNLRNGLAHTLFPQNLRAARPKWKGQDIFSPAGLERFIDDTQVVIDALARRFHGRRRQRWDA